MVLGSGTAAMGPFVPKRHHEVSGTVLVIKIAVRNQVNRYQCWNNSEAVVCSSNVEIKVSFMKPGKTTINEHEMSSN